MSSEELSPDSLPIDGLKIIEVTATDFVLFVMIFLTLVVWLPRKVGAYLRRRRVLAELEQRLQASKQR